LITAKIACIKSGEQWSVCFEMKWGEISGDHQSMVIQRRKTILLPLP